MIRIAVYGSLRKGHMNYKDKIGSEVYFIHKSRVLKRQITGARKTVHLNTGDPSQGRLLNPTIEFRVRGDGAETFLIPAEKVFFSKQEFLNNLP